MVGFEGFFSLLIICYCYRESSERKRSNMQILTTIALRLLCTKDEDLSSHREYIEVMRANVMIY